jgi:predicted SnoaL-like aldol condensation-catalyzing enzyme
MGTLSENRTSHGGLDHLTLQSNRNAAADFLRLVSTGHVKQAFSLYVGTTFKHHNPFFESGALALMNAMDANAKANPHKEFIVHHVVAEHNLVAVHGHVRHNPKELGFALVHIFRFSGGRIVEMWDLGQEVPSSSPNSDGMF